MRSSETYSPMSSRRTRKSSTSAMKSVGSRPDFIDACRRFSLHERRASLLLPSYRAERAAHAATPSAFDPAAGRALYFFTVMHAEPSVARKEDYAGVRCSDAMWQPPWYWCP